MVHSCAAFNCAKRAKKGSNVTFHNFPLRHPELLQKWVTNVRRDNWVPSKYQCLCSKHFTEDCFEGGRQTKRRLKRDAVPTIFEFPEHLIRKVMSQKVPANRKSALPQATTPSASEQLLSIPSVSSEHSYSMESSPLKIKELESLRPEGRSGAEKQKSPFAENLDQGGRRKSVPKEGAELESLRPTGRSGMDKQKSPFAENPHQGERRNCVPKAGAVAEEEQHEELAFSSVSPNDDNLPSMDDNTLHHLVDNIPDSTPTLARDEAATVSPSSQTYTASQHPAEVCAPEHPNNLAVSFERKVYGVHRELMEEVRLGLETVSGTLDGVRGCLEENLGLTAAVKDTHSWLHGMDKTLADIAEVMKERSQHDPSPSSISDVVNLLGLIHSAVQSIEHGLGAKIDSLTGNIGALTSSMLAILETQQTLVRDNQSVVSALTSVLVSLGPSTFSSVGSTVLPAHSQSAAVTPTPLQAEENAEI